jgi:molecular chaperone GrpE
MENIKKISTSEFREAGYLQEANRRFFHPLGLALQLKVDDQNQHHIDGILDYRDDPEGIHYCLKDSDSERKNRFTSNKNFIDSEFSRMNTLRKEKLGFSIEPVENSPEVPNENYLLLAADFENYKKRSIKLKSESEDELKIKMLDSILDLNNDISIALKNTEEEGVKIIANKLENFLKKWGVEEIQTKTYDEDLHEVISILKEGSNSIIDVISKGYTLNGKPFRYPKIILG